MAFTFAAEDGALWGVSPASNPAKVDPAVWAHSSPQLSQPTLVSQPTLTSQLEHLVDDEDDELLVVPPTTQVCLSQGRLSPIGKGDRDVSCVSSQAAHGDFAAHNTTATTTASHGSHRSDAAFGHMWERGSQDTSAFGFASQGTPATVLTSPLGFPVDGTPQRRTYVDVVKPPADEDEQPLFSQLTEPAPELAAPTVPGAMDPHNAHYPVDDAAKQQARFTSQAEAAAGLCVLEFKMQRSGKYRCQGTVVEAGQWVVVQLVDGTVDMGFCTGVVAAPVARVRPGFISGNVVRRATAEDCAMLNNVIPGLEASALQKAHQLVHFLHLPFTCVDCEYQLDHKALTVFYTLTPGTSTTITPNVARLQRELSFSLKTKVTLEQLVRTDAA